jgi:cyclophilin family peptidyl-prolyl cis-trans isomerase
MNHNRVLAFIVPFLVIVIIIASIDPHSKSKTVSLDLLDRVSAIDSASAKHCDLATPQSNANSTSLDSLDRDPLTGDYVSPEKFVIEFTTTVDNCAKFEIEVTRALSPIGADHFFTLCVTPTENESNSTFYEAGGGAAFYRVVPGFVIQFGISGVPALNSNLTTIKDDPMGLASNTLGTVTFATAGPDTRTTNLFINLANNSFLDSQGFTPFGVVLGDGLRVVKRIFNPTPHKTMGVNQIEYMARGDDWITNKYPKIDLITAVKWVK